MHRTVSYDYAACASVVVCSFQATGPLKLIMSNVSNAVNGHTMYAWMYLQNCWQEPSRASVPLPYPRTEFSIANVHYNSNVLTAKRSTQTLTLLIGFVTALVLPFWPVAVLTMNHLSMLVLVHPTSSWMHWATRWHHSALFDASSLASSQVESIPSDLVGQCPMSMFSLAVPVSSCLQFPLYSLTKYSAILLIRVPATPVFFL